jgi:hypothetical protein
METVAEAASIRLSTLRSDPVFGAKRLAGDASAVNEFKTLMEIQHGGHDDAAKAALAASIDLKLRPTLAAATRAKADAETSAAASVSSFSAIFALTAGDTSCAAASWSSHLHRATRSLRGSRPSSRWRTRDGLSPPPAISIAR